LNVGERFQLQVTASHRQNLALSYNLTGAPATMTIGSTDGRIDWTADQASVGYSTIAVTAIDGHGGRARQTFYLNVCAAPQHWDASQGGCVD
jgi:hypothetical protein